MRRLPIVFLAALLTLPASAKPQSGVRWKAGWKDAEYEAKGRNVPIVVIFCHEDDPGKELQKKLNLGEFSAASKKFLVIFADKDDGQPTKKVEAGTVSTLTGLDVGSHVAAWKELSGKFFKDGEPKSPSAVWTAPDGTELGRMEGTVLTTELIKKLQEATKKLGEGLEAGDWEEARDHLAAGDGFADEDKIQQAVAEYGKVVGMKQKAAKPLVDEANGGIQRLNDKGRVTLASAEECIAGHDYPRAKGLLKDVMDKFRGLQVAKDAKEKMEEVERKEAAKVKGK